MLALLLTTAMLSGPKAAAALPEEVRIALVTGNHAMAVEWLAAHPQDPEAAFELGKLYGLGRGVERDSDRAAALFEVAAAAGNPEACYLLGKHHERSGAVEPALRWMQAAADLGHRRALAWLAAAPARTAGSLAKGQSLHERMRAGASPPDAALAAAIELRDASGRTPLMAAAEGGLQTWAEFLTGAGARLDERDPIGNAALHYAVRSNSVVVAKVLLEAGADPDVRTRDGSTALHLAVAAGNAALVRLLREHDATPEIRNQAGWTPAMLAERRGDPEVQALFGSGDATADRGPGQVAEAGTPVERLVDAIGKGDFERVGQLLESGADPDGSDASGYPVLAHAVRQGQVEAVRQLLGRGAHTDVVLTGAETLLHVAAGAAQPDTLSLLLDAGSAVDVADAAGRTPLIVAIEADCRVCVDRLIAAGASADAQDRDGRTALIVALRREQQAVAMRLIAQSQALDRADGAGRDALWWACRTGHADAVRALLERGARPVADREGIGPLHVAAEMNRLDIADLLIPVSELDARSKSGNTALLRAAHGRAVQVVARLIGAGADIETRNDAGDTALIAAVRSGDAGSSRALLEAGASPNVRNQRFQSARSLIEERNSPEWAALLESSGSGLLGLIGR